MRRHAIAVSTALILSAGLKPCGYDCTQPATLQAQTAQQAPQAVFRSTITEVPLDVRVLDKNGKPVTDLTQADFTILEDGVRQDIRHFFAQAFTPMPPVPGAKPLPRDVATPIGPPTHRTFLIVLGRGRLQEPAKGMDGMIHLVRDRLLPQDQVAVLAWDRATEFTTDHERIAQMLERYKAGHNSIEMKLRSMLSGLAAVYGSKEIPPSLRKEIDAVFAGPNAVAVRSVPSGSLVDSGRTSDDMRRQSDAIMRAEILRDRPPGTTIQEAVDPLAANGLEGLSFDEYVAQNAETLQDLGKIYTGIDYLRRLGGEKHLLFVTERFLFLPRAEDEKGLAAAASDARVAIDYLHTGGVSGGNDTFAIGSALTIAQMTGGQYTGVSYADKFVDSVDVATRFQYVLGYSPTNAAWDGKYRRILVKVNRPGVTVLFRHGYYATDELPPVDRQQRLTYSRVAAAGSYRQEIHDLPFTVKATAVKNSAPNRKVHIEISIDPSRIAFTDVDDRHAATLQLVFFCGDVSEHLVGEVWKKMDLKLRDDTYQHMLKDGIPYEVDVPVKTLAAFAKVVVYDHGGDLVGTVIAKIK